MPDTLTVIDPEPLICLEPERAPIAVACPIARPVTSPIHEFQSQSSLLLALLTTLTNGLYLAVWFERQANVLTRTRQPLSSFWIPTTWCLCALSAGWFLIQNFIGLSPATVFLGDIIGYLANFIAVAMAFQVRTQLNTLLSSPSPETCGASPPFSWIGTLFGNVLYLQWKINRLRLSTLQICAAPSTATQVVKPPMNAPRIVSPCAWRSWHC